MKAVESDGTMAPIEPWAENGQNCKYISKCFFFCKKNNNQIKSKRREVPLISIESSRWVDQWCIKHFDVFPKKNWLYGQKTFFLKCGSKNNKMLNIPRN